MREGDRGLTGERVLLDLYSGCGRVGAAARRWGFSSVSFEIQQRATDDLTKPAALLRVKKLVAAGRVAGAMIPLPCTSFSTARNRTSVIRSQSEPWGISRIMNDKESLTLREGNAIARATLKILRLLNKYKVPWIVENPRPSYLWHLPELISVAKAAHAHFRIGDFCRFGARWRKRTGFLCGNLDEGDTAILAKTCCGTRVCTVTQQPHIVLSGNNDKGVPWTKVAEPYPSALAGALAKALLSNEFAQNTYNKVGVRSPHTQP